MKKIGIIGYGNMGKAIASGLLSSGYTDDVVVSDVNEVNDSKVAYSKTNKGAVESRDVVFIATKPYLLEDVLSEIRGDISPNTIIVSIAAGKKIEEIEKMLPQSPCVRLIPNTAIEIKESVNIYAMNKIAEPQKTEIDKMMNGLGLGFCVKENQINGAMMIASCGIAYVFRYIQTNIDAGIEMGLTAVDARKMILQTMKGAVQMLEEDGNKKPQGEIEKVCTPGGITIAGLNTMEKKGFSQAILAGLLNGYNKVEGK